MLSVKDKQKWILSHVNATGYNETAGEYDLDLNDSEKVKYIAERLNDEAFHPYNINRFKGNTQDIIADHLMGLPSWLPVPFSNYDILQLAIEWGYDVSTEGKEDKFLGNYWNAIAAGICQLLNKEGIRL